MTSFDEHLKTWEQLGQDDPLWAVISDPAKRRRGWGLAEFLATGTTDVDRYRGLLQRLACCPGRFRHVLDFGCGVGRLSRCWAAWADQVTGVDVSKAMIEQAEAINHDQPKLHFLHNPATDLALLSDRTFDLVFSHICLQHIPWPLAQGYLIEFARVAAPGGLVTFQLPSRRHPHRLAGTARKALVDALPFGLDQAYRKWRHGARAAFEMHYTPMPKVVAACTRAGLEELLLASDVSAGHFGEGFIYVFRKD